MRFIFLESNYYPELSEANSILDFSSTVAALTAGETGEASASTCRRAAVEKFNLAR